MEEEEDPIPPPRADGDIGLFIGPWGPYVQRLKGAGGTEKGEKGTAETAPLPQGLAADLSAITPGVLSSILSSRDGVLLGSHPDDGRAILLKIGRYGTFLQRGEDGEEGKTTHSLPKHFGGLGGRNLDLQASAPGGGAYGDDDGEDDGNGDSNGVNLGVRLGISLEDAIGYVNLPREVCTLHDLPITTAIGRYGPYLKYNSTFVSLRQEDGDVLTVDADTATRLVTEGIVNKKSSE